MLTIHGQHFDSELDCLYGEPPNVLLRLKPILVDSSHIICPMPQHPETAPTPVWFDLWSGIRQIDTGCTYFYYRDVVIDYLGPDELSIYAHDNDVTVEIKGLNFRQDDEAGRSLLARIDEYVLPEPVDFLSETHLKIKAPNMATEGS